MSAPFLIPFNFQPTSVSVKTASYTIPAGYYACVVANVDGSGEFLIDTVAALRGVLWTALAASPLQTTSASGQIGLLTNASTGSPQDAFTSGTAKTSVVAEFWVPTGTVIDGSNGVSGSWRATVSLYPMIS